MVDLSYAAATAAKFDTITCLSSLPDAYKISWIVAITDLTANDLLAALRHDLTA